MASGDVVSNIYSLPFPTTIDFQPAVGVEIAITSWGGTEVGPDGTSLGLTNGIIYVEMFRGNTDQSKFNNSTDPNNIKVMINNTVYLRSAYIANPGTAYSTWSGIQIK